jgi:hypothetical protein
VIDPLQTFDFLQSLPFNMRSQPRWYDDVHDPHSYRSLSANEIRD